MITKELTSEMSIYEASKKLRWISGYDHDILTNEHTKSNKRISEKLEGLPTNYECLLDQRSAECLSRLPAFAS